MNTQTFFIIILVFVFLTIALEFFMFYLQLKGRKMQKWFGDKAFGVHTAVTLVLWTGTWILILLFQFQVQISFHDLLFLKILGAMLAVIGLVVATSGYKQLGLRRSLGVNFYEDMDDRIVKTGIYKWMNNPEENGYWIMLIGLALLTTSLYNLIIAIEFITLMIPHQYLENIPVSESKGNESS